MNMKVVDYSIIESDNSGELVEQTAALCRDEGWFPCGGICVWYEPARRPDELGFSGVCGVVHYAQALVKYGPAE